MDTHLTMVHFLPFALLVLTMKTSTDAAVVLPSETYWTNMLGDTPMPDSIKKMILPQAPSAGQVYNHESSAKQKEGFELYKKHFFKKKDLRPGLKLDMQYMLTDQNDNGQKSVPTTSLLSRRAAESLQFSPHELLSILKNMSVDDTMDRNPFDTEITMNVINSCYFKHTSRDNFCAASLESMIDQMTSRLGKNVKVVTSDGFPRGSRSPFTVLEIKELDDVINTYKNDGSISSGQLRVEHSDDVVDCHKSSHWPYAMFLCHMVPNLKLYELSLLDAMGNKFKRVTSCHNGWSGHLNWIRIYNQADRVDHEEVVCHFMEANDIAWMRIVN